MSILVVSFIGLLILILLVLKVPSLVYWFSNLGCLILCEGEQKRESNPVKVSHFLLVFLVVSAPGICLSRKDTIQDLSGGGFLFGGLTFFLLEAPGL